MPEAAAAPQVFLATRNAKKLGELRRILEPLVPGIEVLGLDDVAAYDEPVEDAPTFEGNALLKARAGVFATGLPSLADDSGICVDALNGMPGVLSARWSGAPRGSSLGADDRNNALLLDQLADVPDERRGAHFACALAFAWPDSGEDGGVGEEIVTGEMHGHVARALSGTGGFGYDVLFVPEGCSVTSAELTPEQKDAISHRGQALRAIAPRVVAVLAGR